MTAGPAARQLELAGDLGTGFGRLNADARAAQVALVIGILEKGSAREGQCSACHSRDMVGQHSRSAFNAATDLERKLDEIEPLLVWPALRSCSGGAEPGRTLRGIR